jgi:pimeloyl-ACP methyl ester carboxylesterase
VTPGTVKPTPKTALAYLAATAATAAAAVLAACSLAACSPDHARARPAAPAQGSLDWRPCPGHRGTECTRLEVPLDYADPGGRKIELALNRLPATDRDRRIGSLLTNPGGPGASGLDDVFDNARQYAGLRTRYDIVGMDPRGVGRSSRVRCLDDKGLDAYYATDFTPDTQREKDAAVAAVRRFAEACRRNTGALLGHVGTDDVVRDMETVRKALGDPRLNFFGTSYGTQLGQKYAGRYPDRVGRMVLDSVDDPAQDTGSAEGRPDPRALVAAVAEASDAADAIHATAPNAWNVPPANPTDATSTPNAPASDVQDLDASIRQMLAECPRALGSGCPIGRTPAQAERAYTDLLARLDRRPVRGPGGRRLTDTQARIAGVAATYAPDQLGPTLVVGVNRARRGDGTILLQLSDAYLERNANGHYTSSQAAHAAVTCLVGDRAAYERRDPGRTRAQVEQTADEAARAAPLTGAVGVYLNSQCQFWPVPPTSRPVAVTYDGDRPILIVNNSGDTATPPESAERVAARFRNSRLVINDAEGHSAYTTPGRCIHRVVDRYLLDGALPRNNSTCTG